MSMPPGQGHDQQARAQEDYANAQMSPQSQDWRHQAGQEPDIESTGRVGGAQNVSILDQARAEASRHTQESSAAPLGQERTAGPTSTYHTASVETERAPLAGAQQTLPTLPPSSIYLNSKRDLETISDQKPLALGQQYSSANR